MIENSGWPGIATLVLLMWAARRSDARWWNSPWTIIGATALIWSLGPFLVVGGWNTGLVLPQALLRYVPILSNARMPGRAFVVFELAAAIGCAASAVQLRLTPRAVAMFAALVLVDSMSFPISLDAVRPIGNVERALRDGSVDVGSVLELPVGAADGFDEIGKLDFRMLSSQMRHERPIVGGFSGRIPERIKSGYGRDPVLNQLFRLSAGENSNGPVATVLPADATSHLRDLGIRYVVINRDVASAHLVETCTRSLSLRATARDGPRELYELTSH
jgi:hypothetical protein